jgi:hypothetical protein
MKQVWYRADYDYTPINYGGGTDEYFCVEVNDETDSQQMKKADEEAIKMAKDYAADGLTFKDVGHVGLNLIEVCEVDGEQEAFPEIRTIWW